MSRRTTPAPQSLKSKECVYCGSRIDLTTDHVVPRARAGLDADCQLNLVRACEPCNSAKGADLLISWLMRAPKPDVFWRDHADDFLGRLIQEIKWHWGLEVHQIDNKTRIVGNSGYSVVFERHGDPIIGIREYLTRRALSKVS